MEWRLEEIFHANQIKRSKMYGYLNPELNQNVSYESNMKLGTYIKYGI